jgi:DNA replication regulator SLD3
VLGAGTGSARSDQGLFDAIPSSSSVIPSSTMPRKFANMIGRSTAAANPTLDSIQATPARGPRIPATVLEDPHDDAGHLMSSPIMARKAAPAASGQSLAVPPVRFGNRGGARDALSSPGLVDLFETPVPSRSEKVVNDTPIASRLPAVGGKSRDDAVPEEQDPEEGPEEQSIYQRLGWDTGDIDDIDDIV